MHDMRALTWMPSPAYPTELIRMDELVCGDLVPMSDFFGRRSEHAVTAVESRTGGIWIETDGPTRGFWGHRSKKGLIVARDDDD